MDSTLVSTSKCVVRGHLDSSATVQHLARVHQRPLPDPLACLPLLALLLQGVAFSSRHSLEDVWGSLRWAGLDAVGNACACRRGAEAIARILD